eukprot:scaffold133331_cov62-Phaeocystis_antarctica.AAC.4
MSRLKRPFEKSLREVPSVRSARARLVPLALATAPPRAAVRGGRPRSLRGRPRAADWRTQERTLANPHISTLFHTLLYIHFTYIREGQVFTEDEPSPHQAEL